MNDIVMDWKNTLQKTDRGSQILAGRMASDMKTKGFNPEDALEIMAAEGIDIRLAESAIEGIWGYRFASSQGGGAIDNSGINIGYESGMNMVPVIPVEYKDVAAIVEDQLLRRVSAREFVNRLCRSSQPIVPVGAHDLSSLYDWAERASDDDNYMNPLHNILAPFFETTMLRNVEASEDIKAGYRVAESNGMRCVVASNLRGTPNVECCLETGRCSCRKFTENHYADFGIACEHLIRAADTLCPTEVPMRPFVF